MIFTINHIDAKSNTQTKTKFFSRTAVSEKETELQMEDFARISSLGFILSRSGLDNRRSRIIHSGDSIDFHLLFTFNAREELLIKGSYKMPSGQLLINGQGIICNNSFVDTDKWQNVSFNLILKKVQLKQIHTERVKPDIYHQLFSLYSYMIKGIKNIEITDYKDVIKKETKSVQLLEELIYNIFAIGQLNKISLKKVKDQLNNHNENIHAYGVNVEHILDRISSFHWKVANISHQDAH